MMDRPVGIEAATRFVCKVCWPVYDPAQGDPAWQIPPATAFSQLPEHWTCPVCSTPRDGFLVLRDED
jgi:rubredoxin